MQSLRALGALCVVAAACSDSGHPLRVVDSRVDSAGIAIVTNSEATWEKAPIWRVGTEPRTIIGSVDGDDGEALFRAVSAIVREDGRILVANRGTNEIRVFAPNGQYLNSVGRKGQGPGEFRRLGRIFRLGSDSLIAYEVVSGLAHVFHVDGEFGRVIHVDPVFGAGATPKRSVLRGVFETGELLVTPSLQIPRDPDYSGEYRDTLYVSILDREGQVLRQIGRFLGRQMYFHQDEAREVAFPIPVPNGRETFVLAAGDYLHVVDNLRYEIQVRLPSGELRMLIRKEHTSREVRGEDPRRYRTAMRTAIAQSDIPDKPRARFQAGIEDALARVESPDVFPAIQDVRIDTEGCTWVREYGLASSAPDWTVFGPGGAIVGRATLPPQLEIYEPIYDEVFEIGRDYVIGRVIGEDNVEFVHIYTLDRTGQP